MITPVPKTDFELIFEAVPGLYLILFPDLTIAAVSDAYLSATMTQRDAIVGRGLFDVFPDNPDEENATGESNLHASLNRVIANHVADTMAIQKYDIRRPDGTFEVRYWSPINKPVLDAENNLRYIIHRAEDVTSFVLMQEADEKQRKENIELRARLDQMSREIMVRAQEIQNMNAELKQQIAEKTEKEQQYIEVNKELDSFSYSVSHDLRAPLRAIHGYAQILIEDYGNHIDDDGKRVTRVIMDNANRMGLLIDDLLAFSRLGKQSVVKGIFDMKPVVESVLSEIQGTYAGKSISVDISDLPRAYGDRNMIRHVLVNLLSNSVKYSSRNDKITISIGAYTENDQQVYYIKDNGVGFDMRYYDKLFSVFQRLHSSSEFEGTGVGLAIAHRIVSKHHGRIWAEGQVDQGATFFFSLPLNVTNQY